MTEPTHSPVPDFPPEDILGTQAWALPWMGPFLVALTKLPNVSAAARTVGVSRQTVWNYRERDPDFAAAYTVAMEVALDLLEQIAHRRATVGELHKTTRKRQRRDSEGKLIEEETVTTEETQVSNALLMRLLEAHRPERFSRKSDVHWSGDVPGPTVVVVERTPTRERMLELAQLARELEPGPPDVDGTVSSDANGDTPSS